MVVNHALKSFNPQHIIVASGFDANAGPDVEYQQDLPVHDCIIKGIGPCS